MKQLLAFATVLLAASAACGGTAATAFSLPVAAVVTERSKGSAGWQESGEMPVSFDAAAQQWKSKLLSQSWSLRQEISLKDKCITVWTKPGAEELTLMLWRIEIGRSGFSWGVGGMESPKDDGGKLAGKAKSEGK